MKLAANAREVLNDGYAKRLELRLIANTREHQNFRGIDRSKGEYDLCSRIDPPDLPVLDEFDADGARLVHENAQNDCAGRYRQIRPPELWTDVRPER